MEYHIISRSWWSRIAIRIKSEIIPWVVGINFGSWIWIVVICFINAILQIVNVFLVISSPVYTVNKKIKNFFQEKKGKKEVLVGLVSPSVINSGKHGIEIYFIVSIRFPWKKFFSASCPPSFTLSSTSS